MKTNHNALISLYHKSTQYFRYNKKVLIGSGVRYDLAIKTPEYVKELAIHHTGGYLKIAPEHISEGPLALMQKPGIESLNEFQNFLKIFA